MLALEDVSFHTCTAHLMLKGENPTYVIVFKKPSTLACTQTFMDFQTWHDDRDH